MKTILLIIALLLPATVLAGSRHGGGYSHYGGSSGSYSGYRSHYTTYNSPRYYGGRGYRSYHPSHYHHGYSAGQGFDFSAYPTGGNYSPDPPDFQYQSLSPGGAVEGVHTWTDQNGTTHFTDDAGKVPPRRK
jgi:hypothetical protein